jgi:hypothetical protein
MNSFSNLANIFLRRYKKEKKKTTRAVVFLISKERGSDADAWREGGATSERGGRVSREARDCGPRLPPHPI